MMRVTGLAAADEAGLFRNEPQMLLVPQPFGFGEGRHAFVDAGAGLVLCRGRVQFGWLVVALIRCRLDLGEPGPNASLTLSHLQESGYLPSATRGVSRHP